MDEAATIAAASAALKPSGLGPRGLLMPDPETAPRLADGSPAAAICLIGHAGGGFWPVFDAWATMHPAIDDPLDAWSKEVIGPVAVVLGGEAVFPSDTPWQPFQQWAMAAEGLRPSPLGLLIHPEYGLWHGYRGAILWGAPDRTAMAASGRGVAASSEQVARGWAAFARTDGAGGTAHPCDECADKPCLAACPVDAFDGTSFHLHDCRTYLATEVGQSGCLAGGCLARAACPVGRDYRYGPAQLRFHMRAFA